MTRIEAFGRALAAGIGPMNAWTAALLAGALLLDRALIGHARASWRIALYAPIALRIALPRGWAIHLAHAPRVVTFLSPLPDVAPSPLGDLPTAHAFTWQAGLAALYVGFAALLAVRAVVACVRLSRALDGTRPLDLATSRARCPVVEHDALGPMAVGLLSPRIVLPRRLVEGGGEALECVLRHELAHLRRGDAWLSAAMQLLAVIAWPVIPVWVGIARVRHLMELACDEAALSDADAAGRRTYGHALLAIAEWQSLVTPLGAGELHFGSTLRARIEALALQRHWPLAAQVGLVVAVAAGFAACSSVGPPPADVRPALPPETAAAHHDALLSHEGPVVVQGVTLRTEQDLVDRCPTFAARAQRLPSLRDFREFWVHGSTDGISAGEVAFCRDPQIVNVIFVNSWSAEGRNAIGQIAKDIAAAYEQRSATLGAGPQALCPNGSAEPAVAQARGGIYAPTAQDWATPGWKCLNFSMSAPFWFQYAYAVDGPHVAITAHAALPKGDHFEDVSMRLRVDVQPDGKLTVAPSIEETWKDVP